MNPNVNDTISITESVSFTFIGPNSFIEDYVYEPTHFFGSFTTPNRILTIPANYYAMRQLSTMADGEVEFEARITPIDTDQTVFSNSWGMDFVFRSNNLSLTNCYLAAILQKPNPNGTPPIYTECSFINKSSSLGEVTMWQSGNLAGLFATPENNLLFDLTVWHKYKVSFNLGWMMVFIDDMMVNVWYDNNNSTQSGDPMTWSDGYFGWRAQTNSTVEVRNITSTVFFNQVNKLTISPGDSLDDNLRSLTDTIRGWNYSDLFGRLVSKVLYSADKPTYIYNQQLIAQNVDNSDKEFCNQVTVIGSGVSTIARDNESIGTSGTVRDRIIIDYKIRTLKDAQDRAQYELVNANKFNFQSDPKQVNQLGSEVLDVAHILNQYSNTNDDVRIYSQSIKLDGGSSEYSIQLGTGQVS